MAINIGQSDGGGIDFEPGGYHAHCVGMVVVGTSTVPPPDPTWNNYNTAVLMFNVPELAFTDDEGKKNDRIMCVFRTLPSGTKKGKLWDELGSWRGKKLSLDERAGFDISKLILATCTLTLIDNNGKPKVDAISMPERGKPKVIDAADAPFVVEWNIAEEGAKPSDLKDLLPEYLHWLSDKAAESEEWGRKQGKAMEADHPAPAATSEVEEEDDAALPF